MRAIRNPTPMHSLFDPIRLGDLDLPNRVLMAPLTRMRADPETGPLLDMLPIPVGRPGRPEEIAALVEFLLGPDAGFFCGSVVFADGGTDAAVRADDYPTPRA